MVTKYECGTVQNFETKKGFGFILPDNGESRLFFHIRQSNLSKSEIKPKLAVSYSTEISERNGKLQAVNVSKQSVTNHEEIKVINPGMKNISQKTRLRSSKWLLKVRSKEKDQIILALVWVILAHEIDS